MPAKTSKSKTKTESEDSWPELGEDVKFVRSLWRLDRALGMNTAIVADSCPVKPLETSDGTGKLTPRHVAIFSSDMEWAFCLNFNAEDGSRFENVSKGKNIAGFRVERFYEDKVGPKLVQFLAGREEQTQRVWTNDVVEEIILKRLKSVAEPKFKNRMTEQEFRAALDERDRLLKTAAYALQRYAPCACLGKMFRPEFNGAKPRDSWQLHNGKVVEKDETGSDVPKKLGRGQGARAASKQRDGRVE
jgi:hypothetical protein